MRIHLWKKSIYAWGSVDKLKTILYFQCFEDPLLAELSLHCVLECYCMLFCIIYCELSYLEQE